MIADILEIKSKFNLFIILFRKPELSFKSQKPGINISFLFISLYAAFRSLKAALPESSERFLGSSERYPESAECLNKST